MANNDIIPPERIRELFSYDPETGFFTRLISTKNSANAGVVAGRPTQQKKHIRIRVDGKFCLAHRLAWVLMTGMWPPSEIDHVDRNPLNNKWSNLRLATRQQNCANMTSRVGKSGVRGVRWNQRTASWRAAIMSGGKTKELGYYRDISEAKQAYIDAAISINREFACWQTSTN